MPVCTEFFKMIFNIRSESVLGQYDNAIFHIHCYPELFYLFERNEQAVMCVCVCSYFCLRERFSVCLSK